VTLSIWSGTVDFVMPLYAVGELASEVRPLDQRTVTVDVTVRYQACDDQICMLPRTENFSLELELETMEVPALKVHMGHGQQEGSYEAAPHMRRLLRRKIGQNPLGFPVFLWKNIKLELAARRRRVS